MAENKLRVQTRSMADTQCIKEEIPNQPKHKPVQLNTDNPTRTPENPTPTLDQQNAALNPVAKLTRTYVDNMEEYVRRFIDIGLDWYVPNLCNTHVRDLIKNRLPISTGKTKILVNYPQLRDFFTTSTFEVDLTTGQVYMYLSPAEDIGFPCQQEEFDLNLLRKWLRRHTDPIKHCSGELKRIPLIRKMAAAADIMDMAKIKEKMGQYCQ